VSLVAHNKCGFSTDDYINFVRAGVGVHVLGLTRLETIEPDQHAVRAEAVQLRHPQGGERGAGGKVMEILGHGRFLAGD
jgi:hypothetical protein